MQYYLLGLAKSMIMILACVLEKIFEELGQSFWSNRQPDGLLSKKDFSLKCLSVVWGWLMLYTKSEKLKLRQKKYWTESGQI